MVGLFLFGLCGVRLAQHGTVATKPTAAVGHDRYRTTKNIETLRVGDRVLARNPQLTDSQHTAADPDPATWRRVKLRMTDADGTVFDIELLRPIEWIDAHGFHPHQQPCLNLPEMGLDGPVEVLSVEPCPTIKPGAGRVVTGTFTHGNGTILDLYVAGSTEPIGCTPGHPFWSQDRQAFVGAGELRSGEHLRTVDGRILELDRIVPRAMPQRVFNLEVDVEHVYYVSGLDILVHNASPAPKKLPRYNGPKPRYSINPEHVPGSLKPGKTPLPSDAEGVFGSAVPDDPVSPKIWYGRNAQGDIYRFSLSGDGSSHFSGSASSERGLPAIPKYARDRLEGK